MRRSNWAWERIFANASNPRPKHSAKDVADRITAKHNASWGRV